MQKNQYHKEYIDNRLKQDPKYDINKAAADLLTKFLEKFWQDRDVKRLLEKRDLYTRQKKYASLLQINQEIDRKKALAYELYVKDMEESGFELDIKSTGLPQDVLDRMHVLYITVFIACDIIESAVLDMNDLVKKHDTTLSVDKFYDLLKLSKNVSEKVDMFQKDSGYQATAVWRERIDDMYQMMQNKAKKIYQKNKDL